MHYENDSKGSDLQHGCYIREKAILWVIYLHKACKIHKRWLASVWNIFFTLFSFGSMWNSAQIMFFFNKQVYKLSWNKWGRPVSEYLQSNEKMQKGHRQTAIGKGASLGGGGSRTVALLLPSIRADWTWALTSFSLLPKPDRAGTMATARRPPFHLSSLQPGN